MDSGFHACLLHYWQPSLAEPRAIDWIGILLLYVCAGLSLIVIRHQGRAAGRLFWKLILILTLVLAFGKQLDLPQAVTAAARCQSLLQGWQPDVTQVHRVTSIWVGGASAIILILAAAGLGRRALSNIPALTGLALMTLLGLLRVIGVPRVDAFLFRDLFGMTPDDLLQLVGPALILANALIHIQHPAPQQQRRRRRRRRSGSSRGRPSPTSRPEK